MIQTILIIQTLKSMADSRNLTQSSTAENELLETLQSESLTPRGKRKKVLQLLKLDKALLNVTLMGRPLLLLAIVKNLPQLVKALLKEYPGMITSTDNAGLTAFHYAIKHHDEDTILKILIKAAPTAAHTVDKQEKSPLHYAVFLDKKWAVDILPKYNGIVYAEDSEKHSPYTLAKENPDMLHALMAFTAFDVDKINKVFPFNFLRNPDPQKSPLLNKEFPHLDLFSTNTSTSPRKNGLKSESPLLKTLTSSTAHSFEELTRDRSLSQSDVNSSSSHENSNADLDLTLNDIINSGNKNALLHYLKNGGKVDVPILLGQPAIFRTFMLATLNPDTEDMQEQQLKKLDLFYTLLEHAEVDCKDKNNTTIFDHIHANALVRIKSLHMATDRLAREVAKITKKFERELQSFEIDFETSLYRTGLCDEKATLAQSALFPPEMGRHLVISTAPENTTYLYNPLWRLCTLGSIEPHPEITFPLFDKMRASYQIQALLSKFSACDILMVLIHFSSHFNPRQYLVANFIIKEMLLWDVEHMLVSDDRFMLLLNSFNSPKHILPVMSEKTLRNTLNDFVKLKQKFKNNIVLKNFMTLNSWLKNSLCNQHLLSFETLMDNALNAPWVEQEAFIQEIANEFKTLSIAAYQETPLLELYTLPNAVSNLSSGVSKLIRISNQLSEYVQNRILVAENAGEAKNLVKLFIHLCHYLTKSTSYLPADLASASAIVNGLNSGPLSRLQGLFSSLDPRTATLLNSLQKLHSQENNAKWHRLLEASTGTAIPHLGLLLKDITFIQDGNPDWFKQANLLGREFRNFLQLKRQLYLIPCQFFTNITSGLLDSPVYDESKKYDLSYKIEAKRFPLTPTMTIRELSEKITTQFLEKNMLFSVLYKDIIYEPKYALTPIVQFVRNRLETPHFTKKEMTITCQLIEKIIKLLHIHYQHEGFKLNAYYYLHQISKPLHKPSTLSQLLTTIKTPRSMIEIKFKP